MIPRMLPVLFLLIATLLFPDSAVHAATSPNELETAMSETLDLWRDGRYDQLYDRLSHRTKMSKEVFVGKMGASGIRPACCWQKMEGFKVLNEKRSEATVYVKIGLEGASGSVTREYRLSHEFGGWKMHLADISTLAGLSGKKSASRGHNKKVVTYP